MNDFEKGAVLAPEQSEVSRPLVKPEFIAPVNPELSRGVDTIFEAAVDKIRKSELEDEGDIIEYLGNAEKQLRQNLESAEPARPEAALNGISELEAMMADVESQRMKGNLSPEAAKQAQEIEKVYLEIAKKFFPDVRIPADFDKAEARRHFTDLEQEEFDQLLNEKPEELLAEMVRSYEGGAMAERARLYQINTGQIPQEIPLSTEVENIRDRLITKVNIDALKRKIAEDHEKEAAKARINGIPSAQGAGETVVLPPRAERVGTVLPQGEGTVSRPGERRGVVLPGRPDLGTPRNPRSEGVPTPQSQARAEDPRPDRLPPIRPAARSVERESSSEKPTPPGAARIERSYRQILESANSKSTQMEAWYELDAFLKQYPDKDQLERRLNEIYEKVKQRADSLLTQGKASSKVGSYNAAIRELAAEGQVFTPEERTALESAYQQEYDRQEKNIREGKYVNSQPRPAVNDVGSPIVFARLMEAYVGKQVLDW